MEQEYFYLREAIQMRRYPFYYMVKDLTSSYRNIVISVNNVQALLVTGLVEILQQIVHLLVHKLNGVHPRNISLQEQYF